MVISTEYKLNMFNNTKYILIMLKLFNHIWFKKKTAGDGYDKKNNVS